MGPHPPSPDQRSVVVFRGGAAHRHDAAGLPALPVMPDTLLLLELRLQETCVDLHEVSQIILADLGAALQVLRIAGYEYGDAEERPLRIEDCIANFGLQACVDAIAAQSYSYSRSQHDISETWAHSREIAEYARLIAEETPDIHPDEAYLVGLLHSLGMLPRMLGWERQAVAGDPALHGFQLARRWALPPCVMEFFCEQHLPGQLGQWSEIVQQAHERANRSSIDCSFQSSMGPRLHCCG